MATFKCVIENENQGQGWSETYYNVANSLSLCRAAFNGLINARKAMMAAPATPTQSIISDITVPRVTYPQPESLEFDTYVSDSDTPWQAWRSKFQDVASGARTNIYHRGIPDGVFDKKNPTNPDVVQFNNAYGTFAATIVSGGWVIRSKTTRTTGNQVAITSVSAAVQTGQSWIGVADTAPAALGGLITVYNVRGLPRAIGLVRVLEKDDMGKRLKIAYTVPPSYNYASLGYYVPLGAAVIGPITSVSGAGVTLRKAGRVFGAHRGARRKIPR